mgnify:CR=1 FL=1
MTENLINPDPENMLGYIDALPDDLEKAWRLGHELFLPEHPKIEAILISGMGGSAIGGDLLASYLSDQCPIPIISRRNYGLPAWAKGPHRLVICSSHSGNTEEVLDAFDQAQENDCSILVLTTGGKLRQKAESAGFPVWAFEHSGQPRTAIPYSFGMLLALLERLGLAKDQSAEVANSAEVLRQQRKILTQSSPLNANPAMRLAGQLLERNIAIFAAGELEVIARRWKTQINELAKAWASFEGLPEMNHNTLAGLQFPESLYDRTSAIFLQAPLDHPRNTLRIAASMQSFLQAGIAVDTIHAQAGTRLAQIWSLIQFGDYLSYYLALAYGIDPTPVEALTQLKNKLAQQ